jgi:hypothetical protein
MLVERGARSQIGPDRCHHGVGKFYHNPGDVRFGFFIPLIELAAMQPFRSAIAGVCACLK